jgi:hypothetical protein
MCFKQYTERFWLEFEEIKKCLFVCNRLANRKWNTGTLKHKAIILSSQPQCLIFSCIMLQYLLMMTIPRSRPVMAGTHAHFQACPYSAKRRTGYVSLQYFGAIPPTHFTHSFVYIRCYTNVAASYVTHSKRAGMLSDEKFTSSAKVCSN